jgi:hypothetical protein
MSAVKPVSLNNWKAKSDGMEAYDIKKMTKNCFLRYGD